jgi:hypothetical protein
MFKYICTFNQLNPVNFFYLRGMTQTYAKENGKFADRFRAALKDAGVRVSATVVANEFNLRYWGEGISSHAARNWLMGVSIPKQDKLLVLSKWLKISPEGLLFGTPPPRPVDEAAKDAVSYTHLRAHETG